MSTLSYLFVSAVALGAAPQHELLEFSATWCGPCQQMAPIVASLERQGYPIRKIDVDQNPQLASQYQIRSIPAFVLIINGKVADRIVGATPRSTLERMLARLPREKPSPGRRGPDEPDIRLVDLKEEKKTGLGLSLPFWKKSPERPSGRAVQIDSPPSTVIRANLDDREPTPPDSSIPLQRASSTRIRVKDRGGVNYGSGTVIDSHPGMTIVLTCGHIFRELTDEASIEVDVFRGEETETYVGKVIDFDVKGDVGLIAIATDAAIPAARVAGVNTKVLRNDSVCSIGCGGGAPPTEEVARVTALNRYTGPDTIETTGVPMQGRSGGGLFNEHGEVIGVCIAADTKEKRGLYAGLKPIHQLLDAAKLTRLYRRGTAQAEEGVAVSSEHEAEEAEGRPVETSLDVADSATSDEAAGDRLDDVLPEALKAAGDAEVICIIRPLGDPQAESRVVIIHRATPKFVSYLDGEVSSQTRETMHSARRPSDKSTKSKASQGAESSEPTAKRPRSEAGVATMAQRADDAAQPYRRSPESR